MKCPESMEELAELEKMKPPVIETENYVYIPFSKKRLSYSICSKSEHPETFKTYFIRAGNFVKIGKALNINNRLNQLQTGNPHQLVVEIVILSDVEQIFHHRFQVYRRLNEWFELPGDYKALVEQFCFENKLEFQKAG